MRSRGDGGGQGRDRRTGRQHSCRRRREAPQSGESPQQVRLQRDQRRGRERQAGVPVERHHQEVRTRTSTSASRTAPGDRVTVSPSGSYPGARHERRVAAAGSPAGFRGPSAQPSPSLAGTSSGADACPPATAPCGCTGGTQQVLDACLARSAEDLPADRPVGRWPPTSRAGRRAGPCRRRPAGGRGRDRPGQAGGGLTGLPGGRTTEGAPPSPAGGRGTGRSGSPARWPPVPACRRPRSCRPGHRLQDPGR